MFKVAAFALIFAFQAFSLTLEDLQKPLIGVHERGPLRIDHLRTIEGALHDLGRPEFFWSLREKLGTNGHEGLAAYIHACKLEGDTLGTYQRGGKRAYTMAREFGVDPSQIEWGGDVLAQVEKAYKARILNSGAYVSLVLQEWPVICVRPGMSFGKTLSTFVHELAHFFGDDEKSPDFASFENEEEYIEKTYFSPGGEHEAFQAGIRIQAQLAQEFRFYESTQSLRHFDGDYFDEEGLKHYVLTKLGYGEKFSRQYRQELVEAYNSKIRELNNAVDFQELYEENLELGKRNLEITKNNVLIMQRNAKLYRGRRGYEDELAKCLEEASKFKAQISTYEQWIEFYEDLVQKAYDTRYEIQITLKSLKSKIDIGL